MDDLIGRQATIDAIEDEWSECCSEYPATQIIRDTVARIEQLPSAQPEIIYCGDCKYKDDGIDEDGVPFLKCLHGRSYGGTRINDFCSYGERRTNERSD